MTTDGDAAVAVIEVRGRAFDRLRVPGLYAREACLTAVGTACAEQPPAASHVTGNGRARHDIGTVFLGSAGALGGLYGFTWYERNRTGQA